MTYRDTIIPRSLLDELARLESLIPSAPWQVMPYINPDTNEPGWYVGFKKHPDYLYWQHDSTDMTQAEAEFVVALRNHASTLIAAANEGRWAIHYFRQWQQATTWIPVEIALPLPGQAVLCFVVDYRTVLATTPRPLISYKTVGYHDAEADADGVYRCQWYDDLQQPIAFVKGWMPLPPDMDMTDMSFETERRLVLR